MGAAVESYVPGRVRVRLPPKQRTEEVVDGVGRLLRGVDGIRDVSMNPATGGILVEYDPDKLNVDELMEIGRSVGVISEAGDILATAESEPWVGRSQAAESVFDLMKRLDGFVSRSSRGMIDAKAAVPILLVGLSIGRFVLSERRTPTPWYSLLWYGYSMFMNWNRLDGHHPGAT